MSEGTTITRDLCRLVSDGLGTRCERCGCWTRGDVSLICPPYITRCEPDGERLPHVKTLEQNQQLYKAFLLGKP